MRFFLSPVYLFIYFLYSSYFLLLILVLKFLHGLLVVVRSSNSASITLGPLRASSPPETKVISANTPCEFTKKVFMLSQLIADHSIAPLHDKDMSSTTKFSPSSLLARRLYRNLLRASEPFTAPSPNAAVLSCLLHRTGIDDHIQDWETFVTEPPSPSSSTSSSSHFHDADSRDVELARDLRYSYSSRILPQGDPSNIASTTRLPSSNRTHQRLFRRLLREVIAGTDNYRKLIFPSQVEGTRLRNVIRREFRGKSHDVIDVHDAIRSAVASSFFDDTTRRQVAFAALRELNKKLSYFDTLNANAPPHIMPEQAAYNVASLPFEPPSSYLRPGVFLVSHPFLNDGFFSKAVVCILEHNSLEPNQNTTHDLSDDGSNDHSDRVAKRSVVQSHTNIPGQTYGLIINRVSVHQDTGRNRTLREAFQEHMLPGRLADVFGDSAVREGGPVHVALQMLHSVPSSSPSPSSHVENDELVSAVGGRLIPAIPEGEQSQALYSDRATYFQGNMFKAMKAVEDGTMDRGKWLLH